MAFSNYHIELIRNRIRLSEVIGQRVKLRAQGREFSGLCPFHKEKSPSFTVSDDKGFYHCFGCGAHGSIFDYLMETEKLSFPEALERGAEMAGVNLPKEEKADKGQVEKWKKQGDLLEEAAQWFQENLSQSSGQKTKEYLDRRGIGPHLIDTFRLGYAPATGNGLKKFFMEKGVSEKDLVEAGLLIHSESRGDTYDRFRGRLMFPITDPRGRVIAFGGRILGEGQPKYLNSPETDLFHKGKILYGFHHCLQKRAESPYKDAPLVVTEGYMDVIALYGIGLRAVAPLGTALTESQMMEAWRLSPEPVICFDGDAAGKRAAFRAAERVLPLLKPGHTLSFAELPSGEDADSLIQNGSENILRSLLQKSAPLFDMIWAIAPGNKRVDTPEHRALFKQSLYDKVKEIQDFSVRSAYKEEVTQRMNMFFGRYGQRKETQKRQALKSYMHRGSTQGRQGHIWRTGATAGVKTSLDTSSLHRRILLATIVNHPELLHDVSEQFVQLDLPSQELEDMREEILSLFSSRKNLDKGELKTHLNTKGFSNVLDLLFDKRVLVHTAFIGEETPVDEVKAGWDHVWSLHKGRRWIEQELKQASDDLKKSKSSDAWERYQALKKETGVV